MTLNEIIDANQDNIIQTLREVVRIPSVQGEAEEGAPYGKNVKNALEYMLNKAEELGLHTVNFDGQVGYAEYGKGELIAVVAHLDVVPAGDGWIHDPFGGELDGGAIFGRGTVDDKGPAVASLYGLYALKESGLKINRRVRVMFGTNEETGSGDMEYFFSHGGEQPVMGFTPDGAFPLIYGEKGIVIEELKTGYAQEDAQAKLLEIKGGTAHNVVPSKAYAVIECPADITSGLEKCGGEGIKFTRTENGVRIDAEGVSAHGSTPEKGINAIGRLIRILKDIPFSEELAKSIRFLNDKIGMQTNGENLGIDLKDNISGELVLNLGTIEGDENVLKFSVNYRYPVTCRIEDCMPKFNDAFTNAGFKIVSQIHEPALYVDPSSELVSKLMDVYKEQTGLEGEPFCIGGGTYAKSVKNIVAFGPVFPGDPDREHKAEECIEVDNLMKNARVYANAMYALAK